MMRRNLKRGWAPWSHPAMETWLLVAVVLIVAVAWIRLSFTYNWMAWVLIAVVGYAVVSNAVHKIDHLINQVFDLIRSALA